METLNVPHAPKDKRLKIEPIGDGLLPRDDALRLHGDAGRAAGADALAAIQGGIHFDPMDTTYFASRETVVASRHRGMPIWRDKLFAFMHRNAAPATGFFRIPGNRLVELGAQVEI